MLIPLPICKYKSLRLTCMPLAHNYFHVIPVYDPYTWPTHATYIRDPTLWPLHMALMQLSLLVELSQLSTSLQFCQKRNFFEVPKICVVSTWRIICLLLFTLSIPSNQPTMLVGWPFYNSKGSKPNGSASLFRKKNRRLLVTSLELCISLVQWPNLVLAGVLVKTSHQSSMLSISVLSINPIKALKKLLPMTVALALKLIFRVLKSFD